MQMALSLQSRNNGKVGIRNDRNGKGIAASDSVQLQSISTRSWLSFETISIEDTNAEETVWMLLLRLLKQTLIREKAVRVRLVKKRLKFCDAHLIVLSDPN